SQGERPCLVCSEDVALQYRLKLFTTNSFGHAAFQLISAQREGLRFPLEYAEHSVRTVECGQRQLSFLPLWLLPIQLAHEVKQRCDSVRDVEVVVEGVREFLLELAH